MSDKMSDKRLIPCPFCGGELKIINWHTVLGKDFGMSCKDCGMIFRSGRTTLTEKEAIEICNTRKPMERTVERLENASYMTECTFDEDGWSNNDNYEVVLLDKAIEIVKEEMGYGILCQTDSL